MLTRASTWIALCLRDLREKALFEARLIRSTVGLASLSIGVVLLLVGRTRHGAEMLARTHRANLNNSIDRIIESFFRAALRGDSGRVASGLRKSLSTYPSNLAPTSQTAPFHRDPERLLRTCMIVLKSPSDRERGVVYMYYSYVYPLFLKYFDSASIAARYYIVIEPSWSGYCDHNVLCLHRLGQPIFVGSIEPRDTALLRSMGSNFIPVYMGGNTWIDADVFKPLPDVDKDIDVVCVSSWAWYKRHWSIFKALRTLKSRGVWLKVALVGFSIDLGLEDIRKLARYYGVEDRLEFHENLSPAQVNIVFNRSKVNLLWSRREGVNRAIIEGMFANVPCVLRKGFNYGYHYPYINERSGAFASDDDLPDVLMNVIANYTTYSPRDWVLSTMTPEASTARLNAAIKAEAERTGEVWTRDIALKSSTLDGLDYKNASDRLRFQQDYDYLRSCLRG